MKEYTAVESANLGVVISEVNKLLADGREVSGSIAGISVMGGYRYCQPLVREIRHEGTINGNKYDRPPDVIIR